MDMGKKKQLLILIGGLLPNVGGITVGGVTSHTENLLFRLSTTADLEFDILMVDCYTRGRSDNFPSDSEIYYLKRDYMRLLPRLFLHQGIVHFQVSTGKKLFPLFLLVKILAPRARILITFHHGDLRSRYQQWHILAKTVWKFIVRHVACIICVSKQQLEFLLEIMNSKDMRIKLINSYIKKSVVVTKSNAKTPSWIESWGKSFGFRIGCSGYGYRYYGYHDVINVVQELRYLGYNIGLSILLYGKMDETYIAELTKKVQDYEWVYLHSPTTKENFMLYLSSLDLYVRATTTDSFGLVVAEALEVGTPVVASDICERAKGTILYETGDNDDLKQKILSVLQGKNPSILKNQEQSDSFEAIVNCYREYMSIL